MASFVVVKGTVCGPSWGSSSARHKYDLGKQQSHTGCAEKNLKLNYGPQEWISIAAQGPACLIQEGMKRCCPPYLYFRPAALPGASPCFLVACSIVCHYLEDYTQEDFQVTTTGHSPKPPYQAKGAPRGSLRADKACTWFYDLNRTAGQPLLLSPRVSCGDTEDGSPR